MYLCFVAVDEGSCAPCKIVTLSIKKSCGVKNKKKEAARTTQRNIREEKQKMENE
jgi:hypothetical protein